MEELDRAAQILDRLRTMLEAELEQARGQRLLIRALDTQGLFERARQRSAFNVQLAQLERALGETLDAAGQALVSSRSRWLTCAKATPEHHNAWTPAWRRCVPWPAPCARSTPSTSSWAGAPSVVCAATWRRWLPEPLPMTDEARVARWMISQPPVRWPNPWILSAFSATRPTAFRP